MLRISVPSAALRHRLRLLLYAMSRGWKLKLLRTESADAEVTYSVFARGWEEWPDCEVVPNVGTVRLNKITSEHSFEPSGPWQDESFEKSHINVSVSDAAVSRSWKNLEGAHYKWWLHVLQKCLNHAIKKNFPSELCRYV